MIPPLIDPYTVQILIEGDRFPTQLGARNVSGHNSGTHMGEVSAGMLSKLGVRYVVVGYSEHREHHGGADALINAKALKVLATDMIPIICCDEGPDIRKKGRHVGYTLKQVRGRPKDIPAEQVTSLIIAYKPV